MESAFKDLGIKNPINEHIKVLLSCAFHKAIKKNKTEVSSDAAFRIANDGPGRRSIDKLVEIIEAEGFEVDIIVRVKKKVDHESIY